MIHVITTYGGGELFTLVFNGIAALFESRNGILYPLIRIGLMVGLVYVVILMLFRNQLIEGVKWFLWVIVATNLIFLPKTRIHIHDPLTQYHRDIDHVPLALGVFASLTSQVGKTVTERLESVFTLPDYMPYHQTGTVFASSLMSQIGQFRIVDPIFKGNMERFVNQCIVYDAMVGHKYTISDLQNTSDIWALVGSNASPVLGFLYKEGNAPGNIITCREGSQKLNALWNTEIERATAIYGTRVQNQNLSRAAFFTHLQNGYQLLTGIAESATNILRQEMMINVLEEASNNKLSELGSPSNYAATKALLQQRSAYAAAGEIAARTLPLFKNVIEALTYALFIFIVVLALLPNGYKVLLTYCGILVWTQLWAPLYAVLNLIMTLYGKSETVAQGTQHGLTLLNSAAIMNANADMTTLAAWLSVSIPFISYGILKQGAGAFVGLAQHLGSAMQSAASGAAAETVSGNISLGNISMGTQAYQNTTAFQHNTSPSYTASQFRALNTSGIEQSTFADGTQSFQDQALSRLSVQIMGTENTSFAQQTSLNDAKSLAHTKSIAASNAAEASLQQSTNFMSRVGKDVFSGEDFNKTLNTSEAQSLQSFKNFVSDIRQQTGMNENEAVEAAIGASLGMYGIGISGKGSETAARQKAIDAATSVAIQTGYSENIDKVLSAAKALSEGARDTKGSELGTSALASLNHAKSLREEASVAQSQVKTRSEEISSGHSKNLMISKELTQEVLKFIAHQPNNSGHSGSLRSEQIGYEKARKILENGGEERAAYLRHFKEENPQYSIQSIKAPGEQKSIDAQYEDKSQQLRNQNNPASQNITDIQNVLQKGKEEGLGPGQIPSQGIKKEVSQLHESFEDKVKQRTKKLSDEEQNLQKAADESKTKSLIGTVLKNASASVVGEESSPKHLSTDPSLPIILP
ncbi:MAG: conjugal transfer protein TraG N-terminal domain-containing protein [Alphaproteobacteria bacterium]|nr:conjugal transfer protein TraG N-terminal domain-containing protein [Alphaproteobacteria bacterium]